MSVDKEESIPRSTIYCIKLQNIKKNINISKLRNCTGALKSTKRRKSLSVGAASGDKSRKILRFHFKKRKHKAPEANFSVNIPYTQFSQNYSENYYGVELEPCRNYFSKTIKKHCRKLNDKILDVCFFKNHIKKRSFFLEKLEY